MKTRINYKPITAISPQASSMLKSTTSSLKFEQNAKTDNDMLTPNEVAQRLRVSPKTVSRLTKRGEIPFRKIGGQYRYARSDLDRWLKGDSE